jgi:hypothetical protein
MPDRRTVLTTAAAFSFLPELKAEAVPDWLPRLDPALAHEMVGVCHSDVKRVIELADRYPALVNASIDWGFGDWEDALGAASHTGRREIAEVLLSRGARPTIFSAAMLGQLDVVKAFIAARPGIQKTHGPHGIPLLAHAKAGGKDAEPVVMYLEAIGDANLPDPVAPLDKADRDAIVGLYEHDFEIEIRNDRPSIARKGTDRRFLMHAGNLVFYTPGAPGVKLAFTRQDGKVTQFTIADPNIILTARRR